MSNWRHTTIGALGRVVTGKTPQTSHPEYYGGDIPFITPSDMEQRYALDVSRKLSDAGARSVKNCILPAYSVAVSCIGSDMGKSVMTDRPSVTNQQLNAIIVNNENDPHFVYYLTSSMRSIFKLNAQGSTALPILNKGNFANIKVQVPDLPTQKMLAGALSALDSKIEHNNELIKMLDEQAQLVYDYWFMQFDFPDENGRPYRSSGGKMVWNAELGREIPDGWVVATLEELLSTTATGDWGKDQPISSYQQKVYCIRGADIEDVDELPVRYILKKNSHKFLEANDIVIEISGGSPTQSTGRSTFISAGTLKRYDYPVICTNFCQSLRLKDVQYAHYFHRLWNKLYDANIMFNYEGKTSGIKNLLLGQFCKIKWSVPPKEIAGQYQDFTEGLTERREQLKEEQKALRIQRDFLLPLLMSGQVKVAE